MQNIAGEYKSSDELLHDGKFKNNWNVEISQKFYFFALTRQFVNPDEREIQAVGLTLNVWV